MKYIGVALLAIIALCVGILTYDHFFGGTYTWTTDEGYVIATGKSYSECHSAADVTGQCIRER